jgi:lipid-A-disaccharide synthase-like uncharacterized protein
MLKECKVGIILQLFATPTTDKDKGCDMLANMIDEFLAKYTLTEIIWVCVGFVGTAIFGARFIVQWIASERRKRSYIPVVFWYLSIVGSLVLLTYSIYRRDPVFIAGQSLNMIIYFRNIYLIAFRKDRKMGFKFGGTEESSTPDKSE